MDRDDRLWARRAWWMVPLTFVGAVIGLIVGDAVTAVFGYNDWNAPWWVSLIAGTFGTLLALALAAPVTGVALALVGLRRDEGDNARYAAFSNGALAALVLVVGVSAISGG